MLRDLLTLVPDWGADIIIHESHEFGGPTAAEMLGLPHVAVGITMSAFEPVLLDHFMGTHYADYRATYGLGPDPLYNEYFRYLYLHPVPSSISPVPGQVAHATQLLRPELPEPVYHSAIVDLPISSDRKTIYITLGTVFQEEGGHSLFRTIMSALQDEPLTLIVTTAGALDAVFGKPSKAKILVEPYLPLAAVLPHCDLVISHGGTGTTLAALRHGLPQLILPLGADQGWNAARMSDLRAGITLDPANANVEDVRTAVEQLLNEEVYRRHAQELQADLDSLPSPDIVAETIVHLAR
jgi:UDP:flavonoid glycosyltransferase YjiC (YdhE family)